MEVKIQCLKDKFVDKAKEYIRNKTENGKVKENNLSKKQMKGIIEIKTKMKHDGVVFKTDKTGQLSLDDKENYKFCMREHVEKDDKVTMKEYEKTEKVLNATAICLSRILGLGTAFGQEGRVTEAVVVLNSHPPDLYGLRKDHKETKNNIEVEESEDIKEKVGGIMNPANCLKKKENKVGGRVSFANNLDDKELRFSEEFGGKSSLANSQTKYEKEAEGNDDVVINKIKVRMKM